MTALTTAVRRANQSEHPGQFMDAYHQAVLSPRGLDVEQLVQRALTDGRYATVAGLIEGLAAVRAANAVASLTTRHTYLVRDGHGRFVSKVVTW